jgi:hypothetical protein
MIDSALSTLKFPESSSSFTISEALFDLFFAMFITRDSERDSKK